MKLVKMAWVLGGLTAFGLGVAVVACSSSNSPANTGASCAALVSCCATLTGSNQTNCTSVVTGADDAACATYLSEAETAGSCKAVVVGTGSGTGTTTTGTSCASLSSCCATLTGANATSCASTVTAAVDANCATYLGQAQAAGSCTGTTTGTGTGTTGTGTGTTGTGTGTTGTGTGTTGTGTGTGTTGTGTGSGSCGTAPTLHPSVTAGVYCPFSAIGSGGKAGSCTAGQHCCEPAAGTSTCNAAGTACTAGDTDWGCLGAIDCAATSSTPVCCGTGTVGQQAACGSQPAYSYITGLTGTACAASCGTGQFKVCETDNDCGTGSPAGTCVATKGKGAQFGHCTN